MSWSNKDGYKLCCVVKALMLNDIVFVAVSACQLLTHSPEKKSSTWEDKPLNLEFAFFSCFVPCHQPNCVVAKQGQSWHLFQFCKWIQPIKLQSQFSLGGSNLCTSACGGSNLCTSACAGSSMFTCIFFDFFTFSKGHNCLAN